MSEGRTTSDVLEPSKGQILNPSPDTSWKAQGNTLGDTVGKFDVLANGVKEGVSGTRS